MSEPPRVVVAIVDGLPVELLDCCWDEFEFLGLARSLHLIYRRDLGEEPEPVLFSDLPMLTCVALWTATAALSGSASASPSRDGRKGSLGWLRLQPRLRGGLGERGRE